MKWIATVVFLLTASTVVFPQSTPRFASYPAKVEKARVKKIDFGRNRDALSFRTRLSRGLREGVNFAGHYVLVGWGCGTGCISGAIIDGRTGNVFWPEQFNALAVGYSDGEYADKPVEYRKNSRLLIIRGIPGQASDDAPQKPAGDYYYEWRNHRLRQVAYVAKSMQ
jgi:hypothetical protein